jgi:hypothetical protein
LERLAKANGKEIKEIFENTIKLAKAGEGWAAQAIMARLWPPPKGRLVHFSIAPLRSVADVTAALDSLLQATSAGLITPSEAHELSAVVSKTGEALAAKGIEERLEKLEAAQPRQISSYRKVGA